MNLSHPSPINLAPCFHGGAFFSAIGDRFDSLHRQHEVINADVLDAWFPPSPRAVAALQDSLPWILRTSPPIDASGLVDTIAEVRGIPRDSILVGAGSSDLIFRAFTGWLKRTSRVLILDPIYSEYTHVLDNVVGCQVDRFHLRREDNYIIDLVELRRRVAQHYDLIVIVNPNSPTGQFVEKELLVELMRHVPPQTRVWVDEAYLDYVGRDQSLERFAATTPNVVVCKSMSKVYALSGVRVAYLCAGSLTLSPLRVLTPPWIVGLPAQIAAVNALHDAAYYNERYAETHRLRTDLARDLKALGWDVVPGCANFLLIRLPASGPTAESINSSCRSHDLFLRNPGNMGSSFGDRTLRIAVKDAETNLRMMRILRCVLQMT